MYPLSSGLGALPKRVIFLGYVDFIAKYSYGDWRGKSFKKCAENHKVRTVVSA